MNDKHVILSHLNTESCKNSTKWTEMNTKYCPFRDRATCKTPQQMRCKSTVTSQQMLSNTSEPDFSISWGNSTLPLIKLSYAFVYKSFWSSIRASPPPQTIPSRQMFPHRIHYCPTNRQPHANILAWCFSSIPLLILEPKSKFPSQSAQPLPLSSSKPRYKRYKAMRCQEAR